MSNNAKSGVFSLVSWRACTTLEAKRTVGTPEERSISSASSALRFGLGEFTFQQSQIRAQRFTAAAAVPIG